MTTSLDNIIAKVQKLRSLAQSTNLNEANNAAAAADRLIEEHRLSEAQLNIDNGTEEKIDEAEGYLYESGKVTQWKSSLACILAKHYGCGIFNHNGSNPETGRLISRYKLAGRKADIEIVNYMFAWLCGEISRLSMNEGKGRGRVFIGSFCVGAVEGIRGQLDANKAEQKAVHGDSTAMVALSHRAEEAQSFLRSKRHLTKSKSYTSQQLNAGAYHAGQQQGKNIHLGKVMGNMTPNNRRLGK